MTMTRKKEPISNTSSEKIQYTKEVSSEVSSTVRVLTNGVKTFHSILVLFLTVSSTVRAISDWEKQSTEAYGRRAYSYLYSRQFSSKG